MENNKLVPLIKVEQKDGRNVVSAKELYEILGYNKAVWARWSQQNIVENPFAIENEDWVGFNIMLNGNETKDFVISVDFAKRLSMMAKTENGEKVRRYFIGCEKKLIEASKPKELSRKEMALMVIAAEEEIERQKIAIDNMSVAFAHASQWLSILKVAIHNGVSEKAFMWQKLKQASNEMGYEIKQMPSRRFKYQNIYHVSVWKRCYPFMKYDFEDISI
jgi:phage anti-repressor protein